MRAGAHVLLQVELLLARHRGADFGFGEVLEAAGTLQGELGARGGGEGSLLTPRMAALPSTVAVQLPPLLFFASSTGHPFYFPPSLAL